MTHINQIKNITMLLVFIAGRAMFNLETAERRVEGSGGHAFRDCRNRGGGWNRRGHCCLAKQDMAMVGIPL